MNTTRLRGWRRRGLGIIAAAVVVGGVLVPSWSANADTVTTPSSPTDLSTHIDGVSPVVWWQFLQVSAR